MAIGERLISADSHVRLSHEQVKAHLAARFHAEYDRAVAQFQAHVMASGAGKANASAMQRYDHPAFGRPGHGEPFARLDDMDTDGVDAEVVYCEVSAYRYLYLLREGWREATRAFNDAMLDFASADPKRLVASYQVPIHDIEGAVEEVQRVAACGGRSLQLPVFPAELGQPDYFHERYDALWGAIQDTGLPICCHIGLNTALDDLTRRDPTPQNGVMVPMTGLSAGEALGMWMLTGVLERFPELKVVFVEPGLGWVAWYLWIVDDMATRQKYDFPAISELPSFYFHRNISLTFIDEPDGLQLLRHRLGVGNILWSTDYPHPVSSWPRSRELVEEQFRGIPDNERELIVSGNAARIWNL
ncbi:MAG: amidohydrolase [Actinobacteria bacterium]|nr:amidohydrolase [Actinomycetota bacterium]